MKWLGMLLGLAAIGGADLWSGYDVSISVFYAVPVVLSVWLWGRTAGTAMAALAALVRMLAVIFMGHHFSHAAVLYWNTIVFFTFLEMIVIGAAAVRRQLQTAQTKLGIIENALWTCGGCQRIEDDEGHWTEFKTYLVENGIGLKTNKICPDCARRLAAEARGGG